MSDFVFAPLPEFNRSFNTHQSTTDHQSKIGPIDKWSAVSDGVETDDRSIANDCGGVRHAARNGDPVARTEHGSLTGDHQFELT
jgi:hypothetical protein